VKKLHMGYGLGRNPLLNTNNLLGVILMHMFQRKKE